MKEQVIAAIGSLSSQGELSVVSYGSNVTVWSHSPRRAGPENKAAAIAFVEALQAGGFGCMEAGGLRAVRVSNKSTRGFKRVIFMGDGPPNCGGMDTAQQTLDTLTDENIQRTPYDCILIGTGTAGAVIFYQTLASQNFGIFIIIP